jgi:hypothetical protein
MGVAYRREGDSIILGTFGEWDSHIEGGTGIRLRVAVPDGITVKRAPRLSGPESEAYSHDPESWVGLTDSPEFKKCYWYGPLGPSHGWHVIETQPDQDPTLARRNRTE